MRVQKARRESHVASDEANELRASRSSFLKASRRGARRSLKLMNRSSARAEGTVSEGAGAAGMRTGTADAVLGVTVRRRSAFSTLTSRARAKSSSLQGEYDVGYEEELEVCLGNTRGKKGESVVMREDECKRTWSWSPNLLRRPGSAPRRERCRKSAASEQGGQKMRPTTKSGGVRRQSGP